MPEMLSPGAALVGAGLGKDVVRALLRHPVTHLATEQRSIVALITRDVVYTASLLIE